MTILNNVFNFLSVFLGIEELMIFANFSFEDLFICCFSYLIRENEIYSAHSSLMMSWGTHCPLRVVAVILKSKHMLQIKFLSTFEIALRWMPNNTLEDKSILDQVIAWCSQAISHYLSQCWSRSMLSHGVTRPQRVKEGLPSIHSAYQPVNILRMRQSGCYSADDISDHYSWMKIV